MAILDTLKITNKEKEQLIQEILDSYGYKPIVRHEWKKPKATTVDKEKLETAKRSLDRESICICNA